MPTAGDKPPDKKKAAAPSTKKPAPANEAAVEAQAAAAGTPEAAAAGESAGVEPPADTGAESAPAAGDEATAKPGPAQGDHIVHARRFLVLSIVNWVIAIVCWGISSYLGATRPASMFTYTILFVVAIVAVIVGCLCWLVYRFAHPVPEETAGGAR